MADRDERTWWLQTRSLAMAVLGAGGALALVIMLLAPVLDRGAIAGIPNGLFATTLLVPIVVLLLIFWSDERQRRIDHAHGYFED